MTGCSDDTDLSLFLVPMYCVKRTYGTYYSSNLKFLLKVSTLRLVFTFGLLTGTTHYALRRSQHKPHSRIISPAQHICSYAAFRKITLL